MDPTRQSTQKGDIVNQGTQLKLAGLERAASKHEVDLRRAQQIAEFIAGFQSPITADEVREAFAVHQGRELNIGNAMGSLFTSKKWQCVGRVRSKRPGSHARWVSQWQLEQPYRPAPQPFEVGIEDGVRFCLECSQEECTCPKSN
jgi:hypothetical protein